MTLRSHRHPLAHHRVPPPPPELAGKVLAAASMVEAADPDQTWVDRLWDSRPARLLWAASTGALVVGHLLASQSTMSIDLGSIDSPARIEAPVVAALLDVPAAAVPVFTSRFHVPGFHQATGLGFMRRQIDAALEETSR